MPGLNPIDERLFAMAESVRASILYDIDMTVNNTEFFKLKMQKEFLEQQQLNINLYKYKI